jgi:hypothetical protein
LPPEAASKEYPPVIAKRILTALLLAFVGASVVMLVVREVRPGARAASDLRALERLRRSGELCAQCPPSNRAQAKRRARR